MADLSAERFAVAAARQVYEAALRDLRSAQVHADFWREPDGSFPTLEGFDEATAAEITQLPLTLGATTAAAESARVARDQALQAYDAGARQDPLFASDNADPVLLLPVRLEAVYEGAQLLIRVYPDYVHVDTHEPALTEREREAGVAYWRAVRSAGEDAARRQAAWNALVGACAGFRATWVREALTPLNEPPGEPEFPEVEMRAEAWTRAAHTQLLPDRFEFSAYRDGGRVWRHEGAPIPDTLAVAMAPPAAGNVEGDEGEALAFDDASRWLVDFELAKAQGMAIAVDLAAPDERFDLLTAVGVGTQDGATGAERVQGMLRAHSCSSGLAPLPVRTPTNNTPASRSGWRSRGAPPDPDVVAARRAAFDAASDQEAARLARALGVDGTAVLASVSDPEGGDEALLGRLQRLQGRFYAWSPVFRPATAPEAQPSPSTEPWLLAAAEHYARFVRARGPLPPLRIGRQPYGLLPVSATGLWRGDDVDESISRFVGSFLDAFVLRVTRALQLGEDADQDAVLLDLLSREAAPQRVVDKLDSALLVDRSLRPEPATIGAIPASSTFAWLHPDLMEPDEPGGDRDRILAPFPDAVPEALQRVAAEHPLLEMLSIFDVSLQTMREERTPPVPEEFGAEFNPVAQRLTQLVSPPTRSLFYRQAGWLWNWIRNSIPSGPTAPAEVAELAARAEPVRDVFAAHVDFEEDAGRDLPHFERVFRETLEPLSHRIDAWVSSLATARLAGLRQQRPTGLRTGAYGWLTGVEPQDPNPSREGYVVTPSMHHATTAAVLRSGWQAHSDRGAFAVDIQSARVRRAQAMVEGVRAGQTVGALLGYQFERALHDAQLDRFVAGFRSAYPLAPLVEPEAADAGAARAAIGARNVVDGQALRRDRGRLEGDPAALATAAGADLGEDAPALLRMLGELDETFDAVGDLLLAESVHQLVGGSPLRAGLAADAAGRGQDLPGDYDVLRTPRGGIGVSHHVGILHPASLPAGWTDDRPLARLEPGLEGWLRHRLGPAAGWRLGALGWCAIDVAIAPAETLRAAVADGGPDEATLERLALLCERLRAALATAVPLAPTHLDPADPAPLEGYDLGELHDRVGAWLSDVRAAAADLEAAEAGETVEASVRRLGTLGLPVGRADAGERERVRALLAGVDLSAPPAPPDPAAAPRDADAWLAAVLATTAALLHPSVKVAPVLTRDLPPAPQPAADADTVAGWLQDMTLVRPKVEALDGAAVAAEVLAGTPAVRHVVAQPAAGPDGPGPWIALAPPAESLARPQCSLVLQRDDDGGRVCGLVVDSWTEVVPRAPGKDGPEEVVGVAFDFDRPGARAPQSMLVAVPPDPARGWCMEDLHACLDEALLLARLRTLDLEDLPELRQVLPIPDPQG